LTFGFAGRRYLRRAMKGLLSVVLVGLGLALGACERHSWEKAEGGNGRQPEEKGTKVLFEKHGHGEKEGSGGAEH